MTLTKEQTRHLAAIAWANDHNHPAYIECGKCKPYNRQTMDSLVRRGLATGNLFRHHNLYDNVQITESGRTALENS